jgi:hypothetical protein
MQQSGGSCFRHATQQEQEQHARLCLCRKRKAPKSCAYQDHDHDLETVNVERACMGLMGQTWKAPARTVRERVGFAWQMAASV